MDAKINSRAEFGPTTKRVSFSRFIRLFLLLLLLAFSWSADALDYVIVVDTSGSMADGISRKDTRKRLPVVKSALKDFLRSVPEDTHVTLIPFNSGIQSIEQFNLALPGQRQAAQEMVDDLRASGETWLWSTVQRALQIADERHRANPNDPLMVWVLTDGQDTQRILTLDDILDDYPAIDGKSVEKSIVLLGDVQMTLSAKAKNAGWISLPDPGFAHVVPLIVTYEPKPLRVGETVTFTEGSGATFKLYQWRTNGVAAGFQRTFGTVFGKPGVHKIKLTVAGNSGVDREIEHEFEVLEKERVPLNPRVRVTPTKPEPEQKVTLEAVTVVPAVKVRWFVDDKAIGEGPIFESKFPQAGTMKVMAETTDERDIVEKSQPFQLQVEEPVVSVAFRPIKTELEDGEEAQFINECSPNLVRFSWNYGDGATDKARDGKHSYRNGKRQDATYRVTLTASTATGRSFSSQPLEVRVKPEQRPVAQFDVIGSEFTTDQRVQFISQSTGVARDGHDWDFNGEQRSSDAKPEVIFESPGEKKITLRVNGPTGAQETVSRTISVKQQQYPIRVRWEGEVDGLVVDEAPEKLYFDEVPVALVQSNSYTKPEFSSFVVLVPESLPFSAGLEVSVSAPVNRTNWFRLMDMSVQPPVPLRSSLITQNARLAIEFQPEAPLGSHEATLTIKPIGKGAILNGGDETISVSISGGVGDGNDGSWIVWLICLGIVVPVGRLVYNTLRTPPLRGPAELVISQVGTSGTKSEKLRLEPQKSIYLGRDEKTPASAIVCDFGAPDYFILHTGSALNLCQRGKASESKVIKPGKDVQVVNTQKVPQKLNLTYKSVNSQPATAKQNKKP